MKFGTTQTSRIDSGSNKKSASRKLGSSFQKPHSTSAKILRRRISAACASVGALESGFTVEPCATIRSAAFDCTTKHRTSDIGRPTSNQRQLVAAPRSRGDSPLVSAPVSMQVRRTLERLLHRDHFGASEARI